jgi:hypothetical protein
MREHLRERSILIYTVPSVPKAIQEQCSISGHSIHWKPLEQYQYRYPKCGCGCGMRDPSICCAASEASPETTEA